MLFRSGDTSELTLLKAMRLGALALLALNLAWLWYQVAQVNSASLLAALDPEAISKVVMRSRFGMVWLARMMCVVALLGIIDLIEGDRRSAGRRTDLWWWGGGAIGLVLLLTGSLLGHPAAKSPLVLGLALDWLHEIGRAHV